MNKIDELICTYQGRIETETKLIKIEFKEMEKILNRDMLFETEDTADKCTHLAKQIYKRENHIIIMKHFMNELKSIKKEILND